MNKTTFSVIKPTFSAVHQAQESLRVFTEKLIHENRPLATDERANYYNLIASATLGLGVVRDLRIYIGNKIFRFGNVEYYARWLGTLTKNRGCIPSDMGNPPSETIDISVFWSKLLDELFHIYPLALDKAISMSKENTDTQHQQIKGFRVGGKIQ